MKLFRQLLVAPAALGLLAPIPDGHWTDLSAPTLSFHSELIAERCLVKLYVVPDPSER